MLEREKNLRREKYEKNKQAREREERRQIKKEDKKVGIVI